MIRQYLNVTVTGSPSDVHVRMDETRWGDCTCAGQTPNHIRPCGILARPIAFCGVYVRPVGPVPGYWYFPEGDAARTLLASLPVQS